MESHINYTDIIQKNLPFTDKDFKPDLTAIFDPADYSDNADVNFYAGL